MSQDLFAAECEACGIEKTGLNLVHNYLSNDKQTKINSSYSGRYDIVTDVPQGWILGVLFDLLINDLFLFVERTDICNFSRW